MNQSRRLFRTVTMSSHDVVHPDVLQIDIPGGPTTRTRKLLNEYSRFL
jgi:hypothetical protein